MRSLATILATALTLLGSACLPGPETTAAQTQADLALHEHFVIGWQDHALDLTNAQAVFQAVFSRLPDHVFVFPTENYFYWQLRSGGREIRGNLRLASGQREKGLLSFAAAEYIDFPEDLAPDPSLTLIKTFTADDGVIVSCSNAFSCAVTAFGRTVQFSFSQLPQEAPTKFKLAPGEKLIERTWDESGLQFFLLLDESHGDFLWVLNEEFTHPEHFAEIAENGVLGRRTGFAFWIDAACQKRKVLAGVRQLSVVRNDYYDGPFDQLADNYAASRPLRVSVESALPEYRGRIDLYGYILDAPKPSRVALTNYFRYRDLTEMKSFLQTLSQSTEPRHLISAQRGK